MCTTMYLIMSKTWSPNRKSTAEKNNPESDHAACRTSQFDFFLCCFRIQAQVIKLYVPEIREIRQINHFGWVENKMCYLWRFRFAAGNSKCRHPRQILVVCPDAFAHHVHNSHRLFGKHLGCSLHCATTTSDQGWDICQVARIAKGRV